jgi:hypothetical protein
VAPVTCGGKEPRQGRSETFYKIHVPTRRPQGGDSDRVTVLAADQFGLVLRQTACPLTAIGCWPYMGSPVAVYGQFFMAANTPPSR